MFIIIKKIFSILMCLVTVFSVCVVPAQAVAITASTVALGVLATGLLACGIVIATDTDFQTALGSVWNNLTDNLKQDIQNKVTVATVAGTLVANWTADVWTAFTTWVQANFFLDGTTTIPLEFGGHTVNVHYLDTWNYKEAVLYTTTNIAVVNNSIPFIVQNDALAAEYTYILDTTGFYSQISSFNNSVLFTTGVATEFTSNYSHTHAQYLNLYKPTLYYAESIGYNYATYSSISFDDRNDLTATEFDWYITGTGISEIEGKKLMYQSWNQRITFGNTGIYAEGTYTGIADYIYKTCISAGAVGLPLYPGDDVIGIPDVQDGIGCDVYPDYYPGTGANALPQELGQDDVIGIPIPTTKTGDGTLAPDIPATKDLTPDDVYPKIKTGDIPSDGTLDTDIPLDYPIEDVTIPDLPDTIDDNRNARKFKFPTVAITKFPFCIPFDIKNAVEMLSATPAIPEFDYTFSLPSLNFRQTIHISLEDFEPVAKITRWFLSALFIFLLIIATKRLIK